MSDTLYLSLWYPNLRLAALAEKLTSVLEEFAKHGGEPLVYATTVWPVSWQEAPVFQRVYGRVVQVAGSEGPVQLGEEPKAAVDDGLELLHEDFAYEFQIGWTLWELEGVPVEAAARRATADHSTSAFLRERSVQDSNVKNKSRSFGSAEKRFAQDDNSVGGIEAAQDDNFVSGMEAAQDDNFESGFKAAQDDNSVVAMDLVGRDDSAGGLEAQWVKTPRLVRVMGFGPLFDDGAYEQEGHIRIDFGSDTPFLEEEAELDSIGARLMAENVRRLVDLTNAVEKASGATARLLWSELGESLAQRLAARLSKGN
jgi:hypothetical protein